MICNVWYNVLVHSHEICRFCKICFVAHKMPITFELIIKKCYLIMLLFIATDYYQIVNKTNTKTCYQTLLTISNQLRSHFNMVYSTDKMLPVESTPSG